MTTKVPAELSSTPSIVDNGNATAITIDSSENVTVNNGTLTSSGENGVGNQGFHITDTGYSKTHKLFGDNSLHIQADSGQSILMKPNASEIARFTSDGLTFNGDTAAANALDDYEEGTWNPTLVAEAGSSGQSYDRQYGYYTRIGDFVFLSFDVRVTNVGTSGAGQVLTLGNHGFTFTGNNTGGMGLCGWFNLPNLGTNQVNFYANGSHIYCMEGSTTYIDVANHLTTNSRLIGGFCGQINR